MNARLLNGDGGLWSQVRPIDMLWTFAPVTYGLGEGIPVVYHCVDLYAEVPGIDAGVVADGERKLAAAGALAIGTSPVVVEHLRDVGFEAVLEWPSTAHVQPFLDAAAVRSGPRRPSALFAGSLRADKVDFALLSALVNAGVELHLAGPLTEGGTDGRALLDSLTRLGAIYHGTLGPAELADLATRCTVGIIPYVLNPYTLGVSPLKTFEYLGAGLGVVATALPGVSPVAGHVWVESSAEAFVQRVRQASRLSETEIDARRRIAAPWTWDGRRADIADVVRRMQRPLFDRRAA